MGFTPFEHFHVIASLVAIVLDYVFFLCNNCSLSPAPNSRYSPEMIVIEDVIV